MAKSGKARIAGRFREGQDVELVRVRDESVLRSEGGEVVASARVKDGVVQFPATVDDRYIARAYVGGELVEVRVRGNEDGTGTLSQPPVERDRVRLSDGSWSDEKPEPRDAPAREAAPHLAIEQAGDAPLRAGGDRGEAHVVDPDQDRPPYRSQEQFRDDGGGEQMSDTELGRATPVRPSVQRQEDAPDGMWQRIVGDSGQAYPIPAGSAVRSQEEKESSESKEARGEPVRAASEPVKPAGGARAAKNPAEEPTRAQAKRRDAAEKDMRADFTRGPEGTPAIEADTTDTGDTPKESRES